MVTGNHDFINGYVDLADKYPIDPAPTNDEPGGAISLPVNTGMECANTTEGTTLGATKSQLASCSNNYRVDDDVWFKFTATTAAHLIKISDVKPAYGNSTYRNIQVFEAAGNALGNSILCAGMTMDEKSLTGLKAGTTYFIRVSSWSENSRINFKLCVNSSGN